MISQFLNWNEKRVSFSLERLKMINDDTIDFKCLCIIEPNRFIKLIRWVLCVEPTLSYRFIKLLSVQLDFLINKEGEPDSGASSPFHNLKTM